MANNDEEQEEKVAYVVAESFPAALAMFGSRLPDYPIDAIQLLNDKDSLLLLPEED